MKVRFVLVCEGISDEGLVRVLRDLCVRCGATEAIGFAPDFGSLPNPPPRGVRSRLVRAIELERSANLAFVHRDADSRDETRRVREIRTAATHVGLHTVPVVPVRATEAWLLLDEDAMRQVAENRCGTLDLPLPAPDRVESVADPKSHLRHTLALASGLRGRRRKRFEKAFGRHRARLIGLLSIDGPLEKVAAWQRLVHRTKEALRDLHQGPA